MSCPHASLRGGAYPPPVSDLSTSAAILRRVADFIDQETANGGFAALDPMDVAAAVSDLAAAAAEAAQATREVYRMVSTGSAGYDGAGHVRSETASLLPLNRKERFYTGSVLPMLIAGDAFAHLHRFLQLCGLPSVVEPGRRNGTAPCQLLTEYGFAESLMGAGDARWDRRTRRRDTPDVVLVGRDWLVAVEAKMFDRPTLAEFELQLSAQRALIDEWVEVLAVPAQRVRHVALIPAGLAAEIGALSAPVVTWELVADEYRLVGPTYWVGVVDVACERWESLVTAPRVFGQNAEAKLTGQQLMDVTEAQLLEYGYMGRSGGLTGHRLQEDIDTGRWRTQVYEVRSEALPDNPNWFPIAAFTYLVAPPDQRP